MRHQPASSSVGLGLMLTVAATAALAAGCNKGLSEKEIRRIVRDEVQEQLRERRRRQVARPPGAASGSTSDTTPAAAGDAANTTGSARAGAPKQQEVERLRRRVTTLTKLVERFASTPGVSKERVALLRRQLTRLRTRLALAEGGAGTGAADTTPPATSSPTGPAVSMVSRKDWEDAVAAGVRSLGKQRWEVDRRLADTVLKDPGMARSDAKVRFHIVGGKPKGFELQSVRPKGIYAALGLKKGDVIERINDKPLTNAASAPALYKDLSKARMVIVVLSRGGRRVIHVYTIKT